MKKSGVPDLRRGARGKGLQLPPEALASSTASLLRSPQAAAEETLAFRIANLKRAQGAKIIIMDATGARAVRVAKQARKAGAGQVYALQGGFARWTKECKYKTGVASYESGTVKIVAEEVEALAEEEGSVVYNFNQFVANPLNLAGLGAGALGAGVVALNLQLVLEYVGAAGIILTIASKALDGELKMPEIKAGAGAGEGGLAQED